MTELTQDEQEILDAAIERQNFFDEQDGDYEFDGDTATIEMYQDAYDMQNLVIVLADYLRTEQERVAILEAQAGALTEARNAEYRAAAWIDTWLPNFTSQKWGFTIYRDFLDVENTEAAKEILHIRDAFADTEADARAAGQAYIDSLTAPEVK